MYKSIHCGILFNNNNSKWLIPAIGEISILCNTMKIFQRMYLYRTIPMILLSEKKVVRVCYGVHRNLKPMYTYLFMHMLKTSQKSVKAWMGRFIFYCTLVLSQFLLCVYIIYSILKLRKF